MVTEGTSASDILAALADLAPSAEQRTSGLTIPLEYFRWLPLRATDLFNVGVPETVGENVGRVPVERKYGERLAAIAQVRTLTQPLRAGWLFVAGRVVRADGSAQRVFHPLVTVPVRVVRQPIAGPAMLVRSGDVELSPLISPGPERDALEQSIEYGGGALTGNDLVGIPAPLMALLHRLRAFAVAAADAAGFSTRALVAAGENPSDYLSRNSLAILAGAAVYVAHETGGASRAASLRAWIDRPGLDESAFSAVYLGCEAVESEPPTTLGNSPFLLTPTQRSAVRRSRVERVTVVSGAPGNGKSQTVVAMACDALARGESVLVTARSDATVDALVDLFERAPGPQPIVFGSNERRVALAHQLEQGAQLQTSTMDLDAARRRLDEAIARRDLSVNRCLYALGVETVARDPSAIDEARRLAPDLIDGRIDLDQVGLALHEAEHAGGSWFGRWVGRRAHARACRLAGVPTMVAAAELRRFIRIARGGAALRSAGLPGNEPDEPPYDDLLADQNKVRDLSAHWLALVAHDQARMGFQERRAVAALATALRSGRAARREQLMRLDNKLARALPLWVGSLPDVDDLLPHVAGLFDLVIVDEAASVEQPLAAPALLRGRRGVVVGDPRQLRHVSFLSDEHQDAVRARHGIDADRLTASLDVRRNSLFDVAAGASAVTHLDEHFRCDPHLVDFVAERVYDGAFAVATRSPRNHRRDCISARRCAGFRDENGVVAAEVDAVVQELRDLLHSGARSVGVMTPFRAQADAIEDAVLRAFSVEALERLDLRIATVHGFQGNERDVVLISLGIGPDDGAATWRFAEDPHLFAVLATRARKRELLFFSADPPGGGLLSGFLAQADVPPEPPMPARALTPWAEGIAEELSRSGLDILRAYPVGRHVVDVCIDGRPAPTAIICSLHDDGERAHLERHLALRYAGWDVIEALPGQWSARRATLMIELMQRLSPSTIDAG